MTTSLRCEIFPSDLDAAVDFYRRVLDFDLVRDERASTAPYVSLRRGDVTVGAAARPEIADRTARRPVVGVELVLEVEDLQMERNRVRDARWPVVEDVVDRPWGLQDFRLLDSSGYYWRITTLGAP